MNHKESLWPSRVWALLLTLLIAATLSAGCSNPEQEKAEYLNRGDAFLKEKKFQEASIEFRNALQLDDRLAAAHWGLARSYEGLQRFPEAFESLQRAVQLDQNNLDARVKLGTYHMIPRKPNIEEAERLAREVLERDPNHIEGHILLATVLYARGDSGKALEELNTAIRIDPKRVESHLALGKYYAKVGDAGKAEETLRYAISINDRMALPHTEYGVFLVQQNRLDAAEAEFKKAVEVEPSNREMRLLLASFYLATAKQLDKAEEAYKALAELDRDKPEGRAVLADFYSTVGRYDEAVNIYQEVVAKSPEYTRGRYRLGEIMLQRGDVKGATAQVDEVLKKNPQDMQALLLRSRLRLQGGQPKEAIEDLKEVLKQEPRSRAGLYFMAEAQFRAGLTDQARVFVGDLERFYPEWPPAKLMQVQINLATGDPKTAQRQASELLDRLAQAAPDQQTSPQLLDELKTKALTARGTANLQLNDLRAARADMEAARAAAPNAPSSYANLAAIALREGKTEEAAQNYERALSIDGANYEALDGLIKLYAAQQRYDQAYARIDQALAERQNNAALHFLKAQIYGFQADSAGAERELRRTIELDKSYLAAYSALGALYINLRQPDRAIAEYRKVTEQRPDDATTHTLIGMIENGRNNLDAAIENYRRALSIDANNAIAANNLAALFADSGKGNLDEAVQLAQGVVQKYPDEPGFADTLGWVYYKKELYPAAVEQLRKAVDKSVARKSDNALYRFHLGMALAGKGDKGPAREHLQTALRLGEEEARRGKEFAHAEEARRTLATL